MRRLEIRPSSVLAADTRGFSTDTEAMSNGTDSPIRRDAIGNADAWGWSLPDRRGLGLMTVRSGSNAAKGSGVLII